jgi:hypothetical protein
MPPTIAQTQIERKINRPMIGPLKPSSLAIGSGFDIGFEAIVVVSVGVSVVVAAATVVVVVAATAVVVGMSSVVGAVVSAAIVVIIVVGVVGVGVVVVVLVLSVVGHSSLGPSTQPDPLGWHDHPASLVGSSHRSQSPLYSHS